MPACRWRTTSIRCELDGPGSCFSFVTLSKDTCISQESDATCCLQLISLFFALPCFALLFLDHLLAFPRALPRVKQRHPPSEPQPRQTSCSTRPLHTLSRQRHARVHVRDRDHVQHPTRPRRRASASAALLPPGHAPGPRACRTLSRETAAPRWSPPEPQRPCRPGASAGRAIEREPTTRTRTRTRTRAPSR